MKQQFSNKENEQKAILDLSLGQKAIWFVHSIGKEAESAYNEPLVYSIRGTFSTTAFEMALKTLVQKHEVFRTIFKKNEEGSPFRSIVKEANVEFKIIENVEQERVQAFIFQEIKRPFDLTQAPLMRASLIKMNAREFILVMALHHIIMDGMSLGILIQDLNNLYSQALHGSPLDPVGTKVSYSNHVEAEKNKFLSGEYQIRMKDYAKELQGYSGLNFLTTPINTDKNDAYAGDRSYFTIEQETFVKLKTFCHRQHITLFHFLFSVYSLLLCFYTRSEDIVIGVPFANREHDIERNIIGLFTNTLPVRVRVDIANDFTSWVSYIKTLLLGCLTKQDIEFEHLAETLNLERKSLGQHPMIQAFFVLGSLAKLNFPLEGTVSNLVPHYFSKTAKFDLSLCMLEDPEKGIVGYFEYRTMLFDRSFMERLAQSFQILIQEILDSPENKLESFTMLDVNEMSRIKKHFFTSKHDRMVTKSLVDFFSETAAKHSERIGLIFGQTRYNYKTLGSRSNQWAYYIRYTFKELYGHEMPADTLIALCLDRNEDMMFGMLGILKSGAAYVPIDPQYPKDRIDYIMRHSKAALLLTHKKHDDLLLHFEKRQVIYMDDPLVQQSPFFLDIPNEHRVNPKDIAYVLYTSGSTGKPKGVAVTHDNVICLFESLKEQFDITHHDVWSLFHTYCFDISVWEIWGAFLFGGALLIIPYEVSRNPSEFYKLIGSEKVTVLSQTPSAFQMFINEDKKTSKCLSELRYVAFVGESLKVSILRPWVEKYGFNTPRLANMYGITETTVYTNYKFIEKSDIERGRDNIGWPLRDFSMCIMNNQLKWCPVGVVGEICIGGRGLSRGYLYRDDLTHEKFFPDPYASFLELPENAKLYRTGDLGRWLEDGSIEYLGRKDFQIKLRGFRVELGEIELAMGSFNGISHTAVLLKGVDENKYLAAFYTLKPDSAVEVSKLILHLKSCLPDYMIPKTFTEMASFPMTVNGKIDRTILNLIGDKVPVEEDVLALKPGLETDIGKIWADLLNINILEIGSDSNFFNLGGNSLLVIKMLTQVSKKLDREFPLALFIANPTIVTLTESQEVALSQNQSTHTLYEKIKKDIVLDPNLQPIDKLNPFSYKPQAILLTGATGFLGAHLLHELLEKTDAKIYCLVRASTKEEARKKIVSSIQKYQIFSEDKQDRIVPVLGDFTHEKLGLSSEDFFEISRSVDSIFHVGAWVHHILDYYTLFLANVQSVVECLKLTTLYKNKSLHFVSTLAVSMISPLQNLQGVIHEATFETNGYLLGKWVAEELLKEASNRGFNVHIYRPGNIIAGSQGIYEPELNHTLLRLKGMLQLKKVYVKISEQVEMMPVDSLASEIVNSARDPKQLVYNMNNPNTISWVSYLNYAKSFGFSLEFLNDPKQWQELMRNLPESNAMYKISAFYFGSSPKDKDDGNFQSSLSDFSSPLPPYHEMIKKQFSALIDSGFLESPLASEALEYLEIY